jgi:hypothetical protein
VDDGLRDERGRGAVAGRIGREVGELELARLHGLLHDMAEAGVRVGAVDEVRLVVGLVTDGVEAVPVRVQQEQVVVAVHLFVLREVVLCAAFGQRAEGLGNVDLGHERPRDAADVDRAVRAQHGVPVVVDDHVRAGFAGQGAIAGARY